MAPLLSLSLPATPSSGLISIPNVPLPKCLRGIVKFIVAICPLDEQTFSFGIRYVMPTAGAARLVDVLCRQRYRQYKKSVCGVLCRSVVTAMPCPRQAACPYLHITAAGYADRRPWDRNVSKFCLPTAMQEETCPPCDCDPSDIFLLDDVNPPAINALSHSPTAPRNHNLLCSISCGPSPSPLATPALSPLPSVTVGFPVANMPQSPAPTAAPSSGHDLHLVVPIARELLLRGHRAHNPYAWAAFEPQPRLAPYSSCEGLKIFPDPTP
eukprot:EG_transcript_18596